MVDKSVEEFLAQLEKSAAAVIPDTPIEWLEKISAAIEE